MEKLAGYVEHIIYRNTDNGYTVLNLVSGEDEITCVGIFSTIAEGENIEATGDYTDHPTYGTQFKVVSFEEKAPEDQEAIERYLGSGAIKGIGLAMAARIVRRFREDTFRIIEEEPERLVFLPLLQYRPLSGNQLPRYHLPAGTDSLLRSHTLPVHIYYKFLPQDS